ELRPAECWVDADRVAEDAVAIHVPGIGQRVSVRIRGGGGIERKGLPFQDHVWPAGVGRGGPVDDHGKGEDQVVAGPADVADREAVLASRYERSFGQVREGAVDGVAPLIVD